MILTHEVASMKLWIAVLLRQDLFNRAFQHTVLAAVAEALAVLAKFWGNWSHKRHLYLSLAYMYLFSKQD